MQKLFINALKINILTNKGKFGNTFILKNGLNIIRANNSCGKSTFLNAILYALGFEILLGKKGTEGLTPVLKEQLIWGDELYKVLESSVEIEVRNSKDEFVTIRRNIKSSFDNRLVFVSKGKKVTSFDIIDADEPYYLHSAGSAQNEKGFHKYLANFLGFNLPIVKTYQDEDIPLYMECVFPLFFIEQTRGWAGLQSTTPTMYQIKNVQRLAVEFVLNLDVSEIIKKKQQLLLRKNQLKNDWDLLKNSLDYLASSCDGLVRNYPSHPVATIEHKNSPYLSIKNEADWIRLDEYLIKLRENLIDSKKKASIAPQFSDETDTKELKNLKDVLYSKQMMLETTQELFSQEKATYSSLRDRIAQLELEIKNNQDIIKLQKYGAIVQSKIGQGECPTCHQTIGDVLFRQPNDKDFMSLEDSITFLKQQKEATQFLLNQPERMLNVREKELATLDKDISGIRVKIRDINNELIQASQLPKISEMREVIKQEENLTRLETLLKQFEQKVIQIYRLMDLWKTLLEEEAKLPKDMFSETDKQKLKMLEEDFTRNIIKFKYTSKMPKGITISEENYKPIIDGFEMASGSSASDNIRLIWAYTLALQETCGNFDCNHIGITFFDEPGQHEMADVSKSQFYHRIGHIETENNQVLVATSEEKETLINMLKDIPHNLYSFDGKIIVPIS